GVEQGIEPGEALEAAVAQDAHQQRARDEREREQRVAQQAPIEEAPGKERLVLAFVHGRARARRGGVYLGRAGLGPQSIGRAGLRWADGLGLTRRLRDPPRGSSRSASGSLP